MNNSTARIVKSLERESLSEYLPYIAHDPERNIFTLDHGVGFAFDCVPVQFAGNSQVGSLRGLFEADFPPGTSVQFTLFASRRLQRSLNAYILEREAATGDSIYTELAKRRADFLLSGRNNSLFKGFNLPIRDFRLIVSFVVPCNPHAPDVYREVVEQTTRLKETARQFLTTAFLAPVDLTVTDLAEILVEMLNPGHDPDMMVQVDKQSPINEQVVLGDTSLHIDTDFLLLDGKYCKSFTVKQYPEEWDIERVINFSGDIFFNTRQIGVPFFITFAAEYPDVAKLKAHIAKKSAVVSYQAFGPFMKWLPKIALSKQNFDRFNVALEDGQHPIQGWMSVFVYTNSEKELYQVAGNLQGAFRSSNIVLQEDTFVMLPMFIQSLPMAYQPRAQELLRRRKTYTTGNVAEMLPVSADWKGYGRPAIALVGRRGQLQFFDLFSNPSGGYSGVVVASTGAGKSFFVNEIILSYLGLGAKIWVIDVGRSYEKLCALLGGDFITFEQGKQSCINPFSKVIDLDEEMPVLKSIVAQMASREALDELALAILEEAIKVNFQRKGTSMTVTDLAGYLGSSEDVLARQLGTRLFPYTKEGAYAVFFEGQSMLRSGAKLTIFELEELKSKKDLQEVVLLTLIYQIQQEMMERETYKLLIVDEAWDLLTGGNTTAFMENGYRRFRKYKGACLSITQGVDDFYRIPAGRAIFGNSDWMFLLRQRKESIDALRQEGKVSLEGLYDLLNSVHTDAGNYSEIFVNAPGGKTISRLVVSRFMQLVYTTRPDEYSHIKRLMASGMNLTQAIETMIKIEQGKK